MKFFFAFNFFSLYIYLYEFLCIPLCGSQVTPAEPMLNSNSALVNRKINRRKMKNCNNNDLLKVLKMETTYKELPARNLLMSSKNDISQLFDYINKNEELSKLMNSCGTYVYLKYLGVVIFSIKENVHISDLSEFIQYLLNKNVCIEFNQNVML
ncbi:conserved Plasmodium protein, unknown function [Plasmodium sp. gorilla clade G2]|uniref:conserved Plasmodium protein, unknown function n=1 Tax=Plasmodium sp. gorilla clade G2 TaxID=880535 RepID=UPI000D22101A|nr:conserved Plasmodium protein, unknown function [Plasmodium sp. gorilla clade G2]SOV11593.1 conserved Plasmodium protein, unknown function [Plasmodium sp. gorilla clade G2]